MIIIGVCVIVLLLAIMSSHFMCKRDLEVINVIAATISGITLLSCLVLLPIKRIESMSFILGLEQTKKVVENYSGSGFDLAGIYSIINDTNKSLAKYKYLNDTMFDIWISDDVETVEPIK